MVKLGTASSSLGITCDHFKSKIRYCIVNRALDLRAQGAMHCPTTVLFLKVTLVQQDHFGTEFETRMEETLIAREVIEFLQVKTSNSYL